MKEIGANAFYECKNLKKIMFTKGSQLEKIAGGCFYGSGVEELTFPSTLNKIGTNAFGNCDNLKVIRLEGGHVTNLEHARIHDST